MLARNVVGRFSGSNQARTLHVTDVPVREMRARLAGTLAAEGFEVVADIDLGDLLSRRLDEEREPFLIIEACHPKLAELALQVAGDAGLIVPLRFCLWKEGTGTAIAALPVARLVEALGRAHLDVVAKETDERLERVFAHLDTSVPEACEIPEVAKPATEISALCLDAGELATLREAADQQRATLLREAAGTESHTLQHELAVTINRLEAISQKLRTTPSLA
ncbi:MAG TPA: DUF302 domain-containing protein [Polyangia bacterium]